ncbi:MAG TPA: hypothetical protein VGD92_13800 [Sphingobacteriaceae bacterium]
MFVILLLLLLAWYHIRHTGRSPGTTDEWKPPTEIHAPVRRETYPVGPRTVGYARAAGEFAARRELERADAELEAGIISPEQYRRTGERLMSRIDLEIFRADGP